MMIMLYNMHIWFPFAPGFLLIRPACGMWMVNRILECASRAIANYSINLHTTTPKRPNRIRACFVFWNMWKPHIHVLLEPFGCSKASGQMCIAHRSIESMRIVVTLPYNAHTSVLDRQILFTGPWKWSIFTCKAYVDWFVCCSGSDNYCQHRNVTHSFGTSFDYVELAKPMNFVFNFGSCFIVRIVYSMHVLSN